MSRKDERIQSMQLIYAMDVQNNYEKFDENFILLGMEEPSVYQSDLLNYYLENKQTIDDRINDALKAWTVDSLNKVDLAIIRLSATEIIYMKDIPNSVSINEAVEIAKTFGDDKSPQFINAILKHFVSN